MVVVFTILIIGTWFMTIDMVADENTTCVMEMVNGIGIYLAIDSMLLLVTERYATEVPMCVRLSKTIHEPFAAPIPLQPEPASVSCVALTALEPDAATELAKPMLRAISTPSARP